jgi:hypothetical protein
MKPLQQPYRDVFKNARTVQLEGQAVRIPTLEMAIVMKFSAMTRLYRADADKFQDAHDFLLLVRNNPGLDKGRLAKLASTIYPEGGKDLLEMVRKALAGEKLEL